MNDCSAHGCSPVVGSSREPHWRMRLAREHRDRRRQWAGFSRVSRERARWRAAFLPAGGEGRALPGPRAQHHGRKARARHRGRRPQHHQRSQVGARALRAHVRARRLAARRITPAGAPISTPSTSSISPTGATRMPRRSATVPRAASSPSRCMARCRRLVPYIGRTTNVSAAPIRPAAPRRERAAVRKVRRAPQMNPPAPVMAIGASITPCRWNSSRVRTPTAVTSSSTSGVKHCAANISSSAARRIDSGMNPRWASRRRLRAGADNHRTVKGEDRNENGSFVGAGRGRWLYPCWYRLPSQRQLAMRRIIKPVRRPAWR